VRANGRVFMNTRHERGNAHPCGAPGSLIQPGQFRGSAGPRGRGAPTGRTEGLLHGRVKFRGSAGPGHNRPFLSHTAGENAPCARPHLSSSTPACRARAELSLARGPGCQKRGPEITVAGHPLHPRRRSPILGQPSGEESVLYNIVNPQQYRSTLAAAYHSVVTFSIYS